MEVLRLAVPSILANITVPLVGLVDIAVAGHISDASAIGGIAVGTMLFDLLYWNFGFLRVGTGGLTAQAFGRKDTEGSVGILTKGIETSLIAASVILILQWVFVSAVLAAMPCSQAVSQFARQYFFIRIWAAPATLSLMVFKGWFIGMQSTKSAMICDITVNLVNMAASYLLAVHTSLGALGVAHGTLIAQYAGLLVAVIIYLRKFRRHLPRIGGSRLFSFRSTLSSRDHFNLNATLFVRSLCFMGIYIGFTVITSAYGDAQLAVGSIIMKVFMLVSYFTDGFAFAGEALTGRFIGEQNHRDLRISIRCISLWTLLIAIGFTLLFVFGGKFLIQLMTNDPEIISDSVPYLPWLVSLPLVGCYAFMWDGIFAGATRGRLLMNCMLWSALGFFLTYILAQPLIGIHAVYAALFTHLLVRTLYLTFSRI